MFILGIVTMLTRLVLDSRFATTSFFYCLVPYLIGVILYVFVPRPKGWSRTKRVGRHLLATFRSLTESMLLSLRKAQHTKPFSPIAAGALPMSIKAKPIFI